MSCLASPRHGARPHEGAFPREVEPAWWCCPSPWHLTRASHGERPGHAIPSLAPLGYQAPCKTEPCSDSPPRLRMVFHLPLGYACPAPSPPSPTQPLAWGTCGRRQPGLLSPSLPFIFPLLGPHRVGNIKKAPIHCGVCSPASGFSHPATPVN